MHDLLDPLQPYINLGAGTILAILGWFARKLWSDLDSLDKSLNNLRQSLPENYVAKADYKDDIKRLDGKLDAVITMLINRADKN